jgi:hypothetical protein
MAPPNARREIENQTEGKFEKKVSSNPSPAMQEEE